MKVNRILPVILALVFRVTPVLADLASDRAMLHDAKANIENAYYTDNKTELLSQIQRLEPLTKEADAAWHAHYFTAFCYNHLAMLAMESDKDYASACVEQTFQHVYQAMEIRESAELYVLLTSVQGKKIELGSTMLRMTRGLEALSYVAKAKELDPNMPGVVFEDALTIYHTPPSFGGGVDKAMAILRKNLNILETYKPADPLLLEWHLKADTLAWLAYMETECGNLPQAAQCLDQALEIRPDHAFITNVVLVQLRAREAQALGAPQEAQEERHG